MKIPTGKDHRDSLIPRLIGELQAIQTTAPEDDNVLRSLYDGELYPAEMGFTNVPGYNTLAREASKTSGEVLRLIGNNTDIRMAFDRYCDVKGAIAGVENFELFARGFGLGIRLMLEGLSRG